MNLNTALLVVLIGIGGTTLRYVRNRTEHVLEREVRIMATLQEVIDAATNTDTAVEEAAARVSADIQALKDQVAALQATIDAGGGVTSADLQGVVDKLVEIAGEAQATDPAPVVEPPVDPNA